VAPPDKKQVLLLFLSMYEQSLHLLEERQSTDVGTPCVPFSGKISLSDPSLTDSDSINKS
jgi:hypothetical protein